MLRLLDSPSLCVPVFPSRYHRLMVFADGELVPLPSPGNAEHPPQSTCPLLKLNSPQARLCRHRLGLVLALDDAACRLQHRAYRPPCPHSSAAWQLHVANMKTKAAASDLHGTARRRQVS